MEQRSNDVEVKDVQIMLRKEECVGGMGQRSSRKIAAPKDAPTKLKREESARGMEQKSRNAAVKDATIESDVEECARGMEQAALFTTRPLLLDQNSRRLPQL